MTSELATLKSRAEQLEKSAETAALLIPKLESEIDVIERETTRRERELQEATEGLLKSFREDYLAELLRVEELIMMEVRKIEELSIKTELWEAIEKEINDLEEKSSKYELEIEVLYRKVEQTKRVQTALASKAEEIALLQVSVENAARTGTVILYRAEANPLRVAPARSRTVLASMLAAFILCGFLVFSAKLMRTAS